MFQPCSPTQRSDREVNLLKCTESININEKTLNKIKVNGVEDQTLEHLENGLIVSQCCIKTTRGNARPQDAQT